MNKQTAEFLQEVARLHFGRESFQFGRGGESPRYAKTWTRFNFLQRLRGIRLEAGEIVAENIEGKETLRLPLPKLDNVILHTNRKLDCPRQNGYWITVSQSPLLGGDYYGKCKGKSFNAVVRYGVKDGKWKKVGIAVRLTLQSPEGEIHYWEHGKDKAEIESNYLEKVKIVQDRMLEYEKQAFMRAHRMKIQRAARLIARVCNKMVLQVEDAKRIGYCNAGIMDYCKSFGFKAELIVNDGNGKNVIIADAQFASALKATNDSRAFRLIYSKAETLAIQIIEKRQANVKAS